MSDNILKLIESCDPSDTAKMDEIDARVWCYILGRKFESNDCNFIKAEGRLPHLGFKKYTRSRDALKGIRPKNTAFEITSYGENEYYCAMNIHFNGDPIYDGQNSPILPTEELAELHAIIQAIAYERGACKKAGK